MKLNWLSALPPLRYEISVPFVRKVLPELARRSELTIWAVQDEWEPWIDELARVRRLVDLSWAEFNEADLTVFNLEDEATCHGQIWDLSRLHPGLVVLHSASFLRMFKKIMVEYQQAPDAFVAAVEKLHGAEGRLAAERILSSGVSSKDIPAALCGRFPLTGLALEGAMGVVRVDLADEKEPLPEMGLETPSPEISSASPGAELAEWVLHAATATRRGLARALVRRHARAASIRAASWSGSWSSRARELLEHLAAVPRGSEDVR